MDGMECLIFRQIQIRANEMLQKSSPSLYLSPSPSDQVCLSLTEGRDKGAKMFCNLSLQPSVGRTQCFPSSKSKIAHGWVRISTTFRMSLSGNTVTNISHWQFSRWHWWEPGKFCCDKSLPTGTDSPEHLDFPRPGAAGSPALGTAGYRFGLWVVKPGMGLLLQDVFQIR